MSHCFLFRHLALDQEHLERNETVLLEEVKRRAADFITRKDDLQEELKSIQVCGII